MVGIDAWLPSFDVGERHERAVPWPPEEALRRMLAAPVAPDALVRLLFRLRGMRAGGSIEQALARLGFTVLERTATTLVVGLVVRGFRPVALPDAAAWRAAHAPRSLKIAADFRAEAGPAGTRLVTETRVAATDAVARSGFRLYWLVVGPFSALIRRRWLRAAARGGTP